MGSGVVVCYIFHRVFQAYHVPRYRAEARIRIGLLIHSDIGRHQGGQEPSVPPILRRRIEDTTRSVVTFSGCIPVVTDMNDRSLESLKKIENCLWPRWSCLWRPDVTLEFLNQLEKDIEIVVQLSVRSQCVCVCTVLNPSQANCGVEAKPTSQTPPPAQSRPPPVIDHQTPRAAAASPFSNIQTSGRSPSSALQNLNVAYFPFSKRPAKVQDMMKTLATRIEDHGYPARNILEPRLGESGADELMGFRPKADWAKFGVEGQSVLTLMVDMSEGGGFACMWCEHQPAVPQWRSTVGHIRERHFHFRPFPCTGEHTGTW